MATPPTPNSYTPPAVSERDDMKDIQLLLQLEATRRFQEDRRNVRRQVEEQARQWQDVKFKYRQAYQRLARLLKCAALQTAVDAKRASDVNQIAQAAKDIDGLRSSLNRNLRPASLDTTKLDQCLEQLSTAHKPRSNLSRQHRESAHNQETLKDLRIAVDCAEYDLELGITKAMNRIVDDLLPPRSS
ncbi:augmin complex subunit dgt4 isoform X1 [Drosophila gunungcola]|uniref:Uncharacterized protein n=2 Tax=Drosophila gunungcola TaxID=103775 RepID=A0A9P9YFS6_9MUSC|nr:augmin complex subunit dgt4 isoform X1 [Drosophila gunungcola]KAI8036153.1 hypothetical protein M5D96_011013 [Drosophila gunungcola]